MKTIEKKKNLNPRKKIIIKNNLFFLVKQSKKTKPGKNKKDPDTKLGGVQGKFLFFKILPKLLRPPSPLFFREEWGIFHIIMEIFLLRIGELPGKKEENTVGTLKQNKRQSH